MDNIGFEKVSIIDNLPGVGSFELLSDDKNKLSDEESKISFLNNYFIEIDYIIRSKLIIILINLIIY